MVRSKPLLAGTAPVDEANRCLRSSFRSACDGLLFVVAAARAAAAHNDSSGREKKFAIAAAAAAAAEFWSNCCCVGCCFAKLSRSCAGLPTRFSKSR